MSLRSDFTGSFNSKIAEATQSGYTLIKVDLISSIQTEMSSAASQGKRQFTLNYGVSYQPQDLRLDGPLWSAYKTGILQAFASEDISISEVSVSLNTLDTVSTSIDLTFSF